MDNQDMYIIEVTKYVGINANSIDEALYKYREGFSDLETEKEVVSMVKDNDFFDTGNDNEVEREGIDD